MAKFRSAQKNNEEGFLKIYFGIHCDSLKQYREAQEFLFSQGLRWSRLIPAQAKDSVYSFGEFNRSTVLVIGMSPLNKEGTILRVSTRASERKTKPTFKSFNFLNELETIKTILSTKELPKLENKPKKAFSKPKLPSFPNWSDYMENNPLMDEIRSCRIRGYTLYCFANMTRNMVKFEFGCQKFRDTDLEIIEAYLNNRVLLKYGSEIIEHYKKNANIEALKLASKNMFNLFNLYPKLQKSCGIWEYVNSTAELESLCKFLQFKNDSRFQWGQIKNISIPVFEKVKELIGKLKDLMVQYKTEKIAYELRTE